MFVSHRDKVINMNQIISMEQNGPLIEFEASNGYGTRLEFGSESDATEAYLEILAAISEHRAFLGLPGSPI